MSNPATNPGVSVTLYLEVVSSWCYHAEAAWDAVRLRFAGDATFDWRVALMEPTAYPATRAQADWFYRRSGTIVGAQWILHSGWIDSRAPDGFVVPNLVAEAARSLGAGDDRVRRAIADAALRHGQGVGDLDVAVAIAAEASGLDRDALRTASLDPRTRLTLDASTRDFHVMGATQRPTWVIESEIGDRAMLSGTWRAAPVIAVVEATLDDLRAYRSHAAHYGVVGS
ncbi:MAG: disulfide bond formation protein DsbA [Proteobacteria bacterium]|jgi:predicted DsbA family dithiol-disulfide isomerase|nr:disulfide bond formation protein DsbA [Pseudomonadota bacterium]